MASNSSENRAEATQDKSESLEEGLQRYPTKT